MRDIKQLLHVELDRIFDELSKRVDIDDSIIDVMVVANTGVEDPNYYHVVVSSELISDINGEWEVESHDWRKDTINANSGETTTNEHGEW